MTKKSKISKRTYPTQFFKYIPILGPISSFEARKLCKRPISKKLTFVQMLTKCQNFWDGPILLNFSSTFRFWSPFRHLRLGNCKNDSIPSVKNLGPQDQNLRFIHLIGIPSGLFFRLHQDFPFKVQMNSHKCVLKLHWVISSICYSRLVPTSLQLTIPVQCLPFPPTVLTKNSQLPFSTTYLQFFMSLL